LTALTDIIFTHHSKLRKMSETKPPRMSEETYLIEAKQFVSREYHDEIIFPHNLEYMFRQGVLAARRVDMVKKSLYYGRDFRGKQYPTLKTSIKHSFYQTLKVNSQQHQDILHAVLGLYSEAGELLEHLWEVMSGEKTIDFVNMNEELGDLYWYMALIHNVLGTKPSESWIKNIDKLKTRYGDKFSAGRALNRDLKKERRTLER
jgi:NTP pyrophosphatase (non-canonical NTP hydrolase)